MYCKSRIVSAAIIIALMACSFVGCSSAQETEQEPIVVGDSGISLIMPEEWAGKYGYDVDGNSVTVYQLATRETLEEGGVLFRVDCLDQIYPLDYVYPMPGYTIATTATQTYYFLMASDVQYDVTNEAVAEEYRTMSSSIGEIEILLTDWLTANSTNATNWIPGTVYISYLEDWAVTDTVVCDEAASQRIAEIVKSQDYSLEQASFLGDLWIMFNGEEYYINITSGSIANAAGHPYSAVLSAGDLQEFIGLLNN